MCGFVLQDRVASVDILRCMPFEVRWTDRLQELRRSDHNDDS